MATQESLAKGGYYPFPAEHLSTISSMFKPIYSYDNPPRILDPCAGEGEVLAHFAQALRLDTYAIELEAGRAEKCKERFTEWRVLHEDMYRANIEPQSFQLLWMNPPFTMDTAGVGRKRREFDMLQHAWRWLQEQGCAVFVSYAHHLTLELLTWAVTNTKKLELYRLPEEHFGLYVYTVLVMQKGRREYAVDKSSRYKMPMTAYDIAKSFYEMAQEPNKITPLAKAISHSYHLYGANKKLARFAAMDFDSSRTLQALAECGAETTDPFRVVIEGKQALLDRDIRPVVRPKLGHMVTLMAAGMFNNLRLHTSKGEAVLRSTVRESTELTHTEHAEGGGKKEVYVTRPKSIITLLYASGEIEDISTDEALSNFIQAHKEVLFAYVERHYKPRYEITGDSPEKRRWLPYMSQQKVKGKHALYPAQQHVSAAICTTLEQIHKCLFVGEMGVGKTNCTLAVVDAWHKHQLAHRTLHKNALWMRRYRPRISMVICPALMVKKWEKEARLQLPQAHIVALSDDDILADFARAMRHQDEHPDQLHIVIASQDAIKLGEGWSPAYNIAHTGRAKQRLIHPHTGEDVLTSDGLPAVTDYLAQRPRAGFWQEIRKFRLPKRGNGRAERVGDKVVSLIKDEPVQDEWLALKGVRASRSPRLPLWRLLEQRQYKKRIELLVIDEAHQSRSIDSDRYASVRGIAAQAHNIIGLSGTIFNGKASSLYGIETIFNPQLFELYEWGKSGHDKFARDMGVLEQVIEYKDDDKYGYYSKTKRHAHGAKERAGVSPLLIQLITDHTVFMSITDMGKHMVTLTESPEELDMDANLASAYSTGESALKAYQQSCRTMGDNSFLGAYYQSLLAYPNAAHLDMLIQHKQITKSDYGRKTGTYVRDVHHFPQIADTSAKERWMLDFVEEEIAQGRGVALYVTQSDTRDIRPRLAELLKERGIKSAMLNPSVKPIEREEWIVKQFDNGAQVLITNPRLVEVGIDILQCPTLIFLSPEPQLAVMAQAARRHWRIPQTKPCKTVYVSYNKTMEAKLMGVMTQKFIALDVLNGNKASLSAISNDVDLLNVLMSDDDVPIRDLRAEFAIINQRDFTDSAWETEDLPAHAEPVVTDEAHNTAPAKAETNQAPAQKIANQVPQANANELRLERSYAKNGTSWWWLYGNTYSYRTLIKANGGRWSTVRKAWWFADGDVPPQILSLVNGKPDLEPELKMDTPLAIVPEGFWGRGWTLPEPVLSQTEVPEQAIPTQQLKLFLSCL